MKHLRKASLGTKLILGCGVMLLFSLVLAACVIGVFVNDYRRASANLEALSLYRKVLIAANRLSAERGPTNGALGEDPSPDSPARRRLAEFRAASDASLDDIAPRAAAAGRLVPRAEVERVRTRLATARLAVDGVLAQPRAARRGEQIQGVIDGMFDVIEVMRPVVAGTMVNLVAQDQALAGQALMGQMLGDLREYAGRMGSHIATPIATSRPLSTEARDELARTRGRILQIWQLAEHQLGLYGDEPKLLQAVRDTNRSYFGTGLDLIAQLVAEGDRFGRYSMTTEEMTRRYVPTLQPLERLRLAFLDMTAERSRLAQADAERWLLAISLVVCLVVLANLMLVVLARRLVFRPLLRARDHVVALSEGREIDGIPHPGSRGDEIHQLFGALEVLRLRLRERLQLTAHLKLQAATDGLTGLMNRRTFERIGQGDPEFVELPSEIGLILMDVDRFKAINDTYGHLAGDLVLQAIARLILGQIRRSDIVARYGGEEIALILSETSVEALAKVAEGLRRALEQNPIDIGTGEPLAVTASFGVATGSRGTQAWAKLVGAADAALYAAKAGGRNQVRRATEPATLPAAAAPAGAAAVSAAGFGPPFSPPCACSAGC